MFHDPVDKCTLTPEQHIKARLVADGSREQGKLPSGEIYTPVMMMTTVQAMLINGLKTSLLVSTNSMSKAHMLLRIAHARSLHTSPKGRDHQMGTPASVSSALERP